MGYWSEDESDHVFTNPWQKRCGIGVRIIWVSSWLLGWCFQPSQPQRIHSGLNTNFSLSHSHSAKPEQNLSEDKLGQVYTIPGLNWSEDKLGQVQTNAEQNWGDDELGQVFGCSQTQPEQGKACNQ